MRLKGFVSMSIVVNHLSKNYGAQKAVNDISFRIQKGEIVGFLGPNGAGKSTTMKMITGYLQPDAGSIEVCGLYTNEHATETKKKIGYLPEANPLYLEMYVREYLGFMANVHQLQNAEARIKSVIETVGLTPEAHKKLGQLSKGYKQRVGLASALLHNPEVLILDEPTSGLDPNQIVEIRNVIKNLAMDKTILFSSHIMQEVEAICDRVIIINKGNIVADDTLIKLQQQREGLAMVQVIFKSAVQQDLLSGIVTVQQVQCSQPGEYHIMTNDADLVKKALLQLSIQHNLDIVSLQSQEQSLEDVFRQLTTGIAK